jgi:hypothetical protein
LNSAQKKNASEADAEPCLKRFSSRVDWAGKYDYKGEAWKFRFMVVNLMWNENIPAPCDVTPE